MNCCETLDIGNGDNITSLYTQVTGTAIFVLVWPFIVLDISFFPLGRPAAALVGATLMVMFKVVSQTEVYCIEGKIDNLRTIFLLVGMMMLSYYFDREGLLSKATLKIFGNNKPFRTILWKVCLMSALLSAFITNDAACLVVTPLLLTTFINQNRDEKELLPLCLGIATSANIGSVATFFGNPQNAYIASQTHVGLLQFLIAELPAALLGLATNIACLYLFYAIRLKVSCCKTPDDDQNAALIESTNHDDSLITSPPSISDERKEFVLSHDRSIHPTSTSQISIERETLRQPSERTLPQMGRVLQQRELQGSSSTQRYSHFPSRYHHQDVQPGASLLVTTSRSIPRVKETSLSIHTLHELPNIDDIGLPSNTEVVSPQVSKCALVGEKMFIAWLVFITFLMIVLLAIPSSIAQFDFGCIPLAASILTMLADTILNRKYAYDVMSKIDWPVILMFMGLFVWLEGFSNTMFPSRAFLMLKPYMNLDKFTGVLLFSVFVIVGSNILSNVPLVILIAGQVSSLCTAADGAHGDCEPLAGLLLAWISTIAGNFTLIGSVANLIVAEKVRKSADYKLSFFSYLLFGFPSTLLILYMCLPVVYFMGKYVASKVNV